MVGLFLDRRGVLEMPRSWGASRGARPRRDVALDRPQENRKPPEEAWILCGRPGTL